MSTVLSRLAVAIVGAIGIFVGGRLLIQRAFAIEPAKSALQAEPPMRVVQGGPAPRLSDISTRHPRFDGDFYGWITADAFLLARTDREHPRGGLYRRELASGRESPLPKLTDLYNQADGGSVLQISPDGQWVLWWTGKVHEVAIHGAKLDGSAHFQVPKAKAERDNLDVFWLTDSRRFVELAMPHGNKYTAALVRNTEKPELSESLRITADSPLQAACAVAGRDVVLAADDQLIALPCGLNSYGSVDPSLVIGISGVLNPKIAVDRTSSIKLPSKSMMSCGVAGGASSDRIAWLIASTSENNETSVGLWVSGLDGANWQKIGFERTSKPDTGFGEHLAKFMRESPGSIQWLPDGKSLSFFYKGELFTVPAPRE